MRKIDFKKLTREDLLTENAVAKAFAAHLMAELGYSEIEANIASGDLKTAYDVPYMVEDYHCTATIDGVTYEVYFCKTDYSRCFDMRHLAGTKPFEYYKLYAAADLPNKTVGEYIAAQKYYIV